MKRVAYLAWYRDYPDEGCVPVLAYDEADAVIEACTAFGCDMRELAERECSPQQVVEVVRAPSMDHHESLETITEAEIEAAATLILAGDKAIAMLGSEERGHG